MKRLPNGYGSVVFLGNNRTKPYAIRKTAGYDENGKQKYTYIDCYRTREDAWQALVELNKTEISLDDINITFAQVFEAWWRDCKMDDRPKGSTNTFRTSFNHCEPLHNMRMRKIKKRDMQDIMDAKPGYATRANIKNLCNQMSAYAVDNDIILKNYAANLDAGQTDAPQNPHKVIPQEIMWKLVRYTNQELADVFAVMLYTGARIDEILKIKSANVHIDEKYMIGGNKTGAGKERTIPIADYILPIVKRRLLDGGKTLFAYPTGKRLSYDALKYHLLKFNSENETNVQSHDCRHTFITAMDKLGVKKPLYQKIVGHKASDVTDAVYTHYSVEEMLEAVNKLEAVYRV